MSQTTELEHVWKVHTPSLLEEIINSSSQPILKIPIKQLGTLLAMIGERAAEINDPRLNALMCRLAIYSIADPHSPDYEPETVRSILEEQGWA